MKSKAFAIAAMIFTSVFAAPCYAASGKPVISTKSNIELPLVKGKKSVVCVNRNFYDTQKFGNALCAALDGYSFDCIVKLAEFIPKEKVVGYDYVWTFQIKSWKDKNLDDIPEKISALVLIYDRDFNLLLKSNLKAKKSSDPQAPDCLDRLVNEYVKSLFEKVVEANESAAGAKGAEVSASDSKAKKSKKNEKQAE
mgnify:CR=1 FL=1